VTSPQAGRGPGTQQRGNTPRQQNRYLLRLRRPPRPSATTPS